MVTSHEMELAQEIAELHRSAQNRRRAEARGLTITTVSWEDTGRSKNSCWGPNISDLTLNALDKRMALVRKPNFSDVTADVPMKHFQVTVGNETAGRDLQRIPLEEYLLNLGKYAGAKLDTPVVRERDDVVLCSAQACILPLGESGEVDFVPELFSYQSTSEDPAVLVVVASAQGTSAHVITQRDQKLFFNRGGQATKFSAKRLKQDRKERGVTLEGRMDAEEMDRNVLILYQIPLKQTQRAPVMYGGGEPTVEALYVSGGIGIAKGFRRGGAVRQSSRNGMDFAMLRSADKAEGNFQGLSKFRIERDDRFPIRATFQLYRVTDDPNVSEDMFAGIAESIESVYHMAEEKGSLVHDYTNRKTETTPLPALGQLPSGSAGSLFSAFRPAAEHTRVEKADDDFIQIESATF